MSNSQRKILLINQRFQWRLAFYVCSWVVALCFIYPLIISNLFEFFIRYAELDPMGPNLSALKQTRHDILILLIMLQVAYFLLTLLVSLFMGHRIAGPIHKIKILFRKVKEGDLSEELHLRKFDHFKDMAEEYNAMLVALRQRLSKTAVQIEAAKEHCNEEGKKKLDDALKALAGLSVE